MKLFLVDIGNKYMLVQEIEGIDVPIVDYVHGELAVFDKQFIDEQRRKIKS